MWTLIPGVPIGCRSPRKRGPYSMPNDRLQPFRHLHDCSGCFRLERSPGGTCTHWKAPPSHGARKLRSFPNDVATLRPVRCSLRGVDFHCQAKRFDGRHGYSVLKLPELTVPWFERSFLSEGFVYRFTPAGCAAASTAANTSTIGAGLTTNKPE